MTRRLSVRFAAFTKSAVSKLCMKEEPYEHRESNVDFFSVSSRETVFWELRRSPSVFAKEMEGALQTIRNEPVIRRSLKS